MNIEAKMPLMLTYIENEIRIISKSFKQQTSKFSLKLTIH